MKTGPHWPRLLARWRSPNHEKHSGGAARQGADGPRESPASKVIFCKWQSFEMQVLTRWPRSGHPIIDKNKSAKQKREAPKRKMAAMLSHGGHSFLKLSIHWTSMNVATNKKIALLKIFL